MRAFGETVDYTTAGGVTVTLPDAVFDEAYTSVSALSEPGVTSVRPVLGVRIALMPAGFDAQNAQGDRFTVRRTGVTYVVKTGEPDGHGWARLDATLAP